VRINKRVEAEIAEAFEAALDKIRALDRAPFHIKREAAEMVAKDAFAYIKREAE
jgi:hypothetical protein